MDTGLAPAHIQTPWRLAPGRHLGYPGPIVELS
jgi:hypothetical protein